MTRPSILALDLSLAATGWALDNESGTIRSSATHQLEERLHHIVTSIYVAGICEHDIELVVIEDFVTRSPAASLLGMVHGAVRLHLHRTGIPIALVPPASLKRYATGRGNATKADMRIAHLQRFGHDVTDDNEVDARWLHAMALDHYGHPPITLPAGHRDALTKVTWPDLTPQEHAA